MRMMDMCIVWHGIGTVMFKINQNYVTGKCTMIPICFYQDYDKSVRFWNDIRQGYTSNSSVASEPIWTGWFSSVSREKQIELLIEFDSLTDMYSTVKDENWQITFFNNDYFWRVAKNFECLSYNGLYPLDLIHSMLIIPD
jgi:hypothetical protein